MFSVCRLVSRRCHKISAMRRFSPGSSQNRTWSVTPSGSQPESSTVERGQQPFLPHRLRAPGVRPGARSFLLPSCERRKFRYHGQSPHGVGPCFACAFSQAATPLLDPHYRASALLWVAPTSKHHRPCPRFLHLFTGARLPRTAAWISLVTAYSHCQARYGLRPRGASAPHSPHCATDCCLPKS